MCVHDNSSLNDFTLRFSAYVLRASLDVDACQTPAVELIMPRGLQKKDALARRLFHEFNSRVFGNQVGCAHQYSNLCHNSSAR